MSIEDEAQRIAAQSLASHFHMFARNGRWGTCDECPRDARREYLPELCARFDEPDHRLTLEELGAKLTELAARNREHLATIHRRP